MLKILDQGGTIDVAFDTVPHQRLLIKLEAYGIQGKVLEWIGQFLVGRRQRVGVMGVFSEWSEVVSGVPQGSVLGPALFVVYINDLPEEIASVIYMYADDTKLFGRVDCDVDRQTLQRDLDTLSSWAEKWQLRFNVQKCKIMHLGGARNAGAVYKMTEVGGGKVALAETKEEKDLGVWVDDTCKPTSHVMHAANKANQLLGLIRRTFTYLDGPLVKQLYTAIVRPHLEYANVVWHPFLKKDIEQLERVQHRATRMIPGFAKLSYEERLRRIDLPTLVYRRNRGDAIEVFKYLKGLYNTDCSEMLPRHVDVGMKTRGHGMRLMKRGCNGQLRQNVFGMRVVNVWNGLAAEVVEAPSVNCFKGRFDRMCQRNRFCMEWEADDQQRGKDNG